ncbi:hypothetical protein [Rhizobium sp. PP-CC-3G-465]|uniref:hypothetical protein n=1 Tax=Rhizobium sp. PP-CC-3G-465 TaxID=2135648 RepID=UPI0010DA9135|nr:hypothetical protein C8J33_10317 [Rhizobium sp. PP-CC-3G-465]
MSAVLICLASFSATSAAHALEFDVNGMAIGMNADEVVARYQALRPEGQYSFSKWKLPEGSEWVANGRTLYNDMGHPDDMEHERMKFAFTGLGSGNKLFAVKRGLTFRPSQRPSTESVYAAAVAKYGEPSDMSKADGDIWAIWKFSSLESAAEKLDNYPACIGSTDFPVGLNDQTARKASLNAETCGLFIEVTVSGDPTGLAEELDTGMMNYLDLPRDFDADNQDVRQKINAAKSRSTSAAAPAPEL